MFVNEVIEQAFARSGTPEIVNDDQGSQFTAEEFTAVVLATVCKFFMGERGACRDIVYVEHPLRTAKYERVCLKAYDSVIAARAEIVENLDGYNVYCAHSSLEGLTPNEKCLVALPPISMAT